jgi:glycosyltransferase involved in cell wall biosynthesis
MTSRAIKLALVTRRYPPLIGGAEKVFCYLAGALAALGAHVTVVTSQAPGIELPDRQAISVEPVEGIGTAHSTRDGGLSVVRLETSRLRFWGTWRYMRNLAGWFDRNAVDLAYVSMLKHDAYVAVRAGRRLGFPVVLRPEGAGATGDVAWQSWGNFGRRIGLACRQANAIVSISKSVESELHQALHSGTMRPAASSNPRENAPRIVSISNGVPVPNLPWQARLGWYTAPRAIFVGRLAPEKGLDTLIAAWREVRARFPMAQLILVGEGPERGALEDQARTIKLTTGHGRAVDFPGSVVDSTDALRQADLFVLPSREEGMSIALLEAMALGLPVVASSISGNQKLIDDMEQGRLVSPDDPVKLAHAIIGQWEDFERAVTMGRAARSRVEREFSIQAVARTHLALFHELIVNR